MLHHIIQGSNLHSLVHHANHLYLFLQTNISNFDNENLQERFHVLTETVDALTRQIENTKIEYEEEKKKRIEADKNILSNCSAINSVRWENFRFYFVMI